MEEFMVVLLGNYGFEKPTFEVIEKHSWHFRPVSIKLIFFVEKFFTTEKLLIETLAGRLMYVVLKKLNLLVVICQHHQQFFISSQCQNFNRREKPHFLYYHSP